MKRVLSIFFVICLLLCACTKAPAEQTTEQAQVTTVNVTTEQTTEAATSEPTQETTVPDTTGDTTPIDLKYQNPLTGEPLAELYTARPFAVMINNSSYAQPMCSLNSADIVFEILAEGGITRCMAVFGDVAGLDHIGAIRSARPYYVRLAYSLDAIFVHHGGSNAGIAEARALGLDRLDFLGNAGEVYYRDQDRLNSGYVLEHTSFADGDDMLERVEELEFETARENGIDYGFMFADAGSTADGESVTDFKVVFGGCNKTTGFAYDESTGKYAASQYGDDIVDGNTDEIVSYRNVLMITAETHTNDDSTLVIDLLGEGDGYFACDGKIVPINWSRSAEGEPFVFTHEDGTPITFGVGNTYIAVTPLNGVLEY